MWKVNKTWPSAKLYSSLRKNISRMHDAMQRNFTAIAFFSMTVILKVTHIWNPTITDIDSTMLLVKSDMSK